MAGSLCWEYRPAERGTGAYWARQPDAFEVTIAAGAPVAWPREAPPVPSDITRTAALLRRLDGEERAIALVTPEGDIYRLQRHDESAEPGIPGLVIALTAELPDPEVMPAIDRAPTAEELASLLLWSALGGARVPILPAAWRALPTNHPLALRLRTELGKRCAIYDGPPDLIERVTGGNIGTASLRGAHRVALLQLDWETQLSERDWNLHDWLTAADPVWRRVQAVVPPLGFLSHLSDGRLTPEDSATVAAAIGTLYVNHLDLPLASVASLAQQLDALGLPHHLREATPQIVPVAGSTPEDFGIRIDESGLVWRHPPVESILAEDLAQLALGPHREVIPGELVAASKAALEREPTAPDIALYWWQLGVEMSLDKLFEPTALSDALRWTEARLRGRNPRQDPRWVAGLLDLAERTYAAQGPLPAVLAKQLCGVVGQTMSATATLHERVASVTRCLGLTDVRERKALLPGLGLSFSRLGGAGFEVQTTQAPCREELAMPAHLDPRATSPAAARAGGDVIHG